MMGTVDVTALSDGDLDRELTRMVWGVDPAGPCTHPGSDESPHTVEEHYGFPTPTSDGNEMVSLIDKMRERFGVVEMGATRDNLSPNAPEWFAFVGRSSARAHTLPRAVAEAAYIALSPVRGVPMMESREGTVERLTVEDARLDYVAVEHNASTDEERDTAFDRLRAAVGYTRNEDADED